MAAARPDPLALLAAGLATFGLVGLAGLSVVFRYLLLPAVMLVLFAGLAVTGWTLLAPGGRARRAWAAGASTLVLAGAVYMAAHVTSGAFVTELDFRRDSHAALVALLRDPAVRAARACGPVSLPNHRLVPEALDLQAPGRATSSPAATARSAGACAAAAWRSTRRARPRSSTRLQPRPRRRGAAAPRLPPGGYDRALRRLRALLTAPRAGEDRVTEGP